MRTTFHVPLASASSVPAGTQPRRAMAPLRPTMTAVSALTTPAAGFSSQGSLHTAIPDPDCTATAHVDSRYRTRSVAQSALLFLLFFAAWVALLGLSGSPTAALVSATHATPAVARLIYEVMPLLTVLIPTVACGLVFRRYARIPALVRPRREGVDTAIGMGLGLGLSAACTGLLWALGNLGISGVSMWDGSLPIWTLALALNAAFQEYLVHGWGFDVLVRGHGPVSAVAVTTVLFAFLHPGAFMAGPMAVACIAAFGALLAVLRLVTGGLLAPILAHAIWNILGGIGLGLVTLADDYPHVLNATLDGGPLSAASMGLEGSLVTLLVVLAALAVLALIYRHQCRSIARS